MLWLRNNLYLFVLVDFIYDTEKLFSSDRRDASCKINQKKKDEIQNFFINVLVW